MAEHHSEIIFVRKKGGHVAGHHGGAWKIAFADFMTAMMAFFLVLWIINATDKDTKTVIARYFNPVKLENPARAKKGVHGVDSNAKVLSEDSSGDQDGAPSSDKDGKDAKAPTGGVAASPKKEDKAKSAAPRPEPPSPVDVKPTASEAAIFSDPYETLDEIAGGRAAMSPAAAPDTGASDPTREAGATTAEAFRDPFKPVGPGAVNDSVAFDADSAPPPTPAQSLDLQPQKGGEDKSATVADAKGAEAKSGPGKTPAPEPRASDAAAKLEKDLEQKLGALAKSPTSPAIDVKATSEGVLISVTDRLTFSMFAIGSAEPRRELVEAMEAIARTLKGEPGAIVLRGHTDGRPYRSATYDNWRLSSARAQMAYYMLIRGGVPEARFERVEGHADRSLRDAAHPLAAENRRLEILLREPKP
jgi:chemotaxis protein MotB